MLEISVFMAESICIILGERVMLLIFINILFISFYLEVSYMCLLFAGCLLSAYVLCGKMSNGHWEQREQGNMNNI